MHRGFMALQTLRLKTSSERLEVVAEVGEAADD
jgi:hypothetical protein